MAGFRRTQARIVGAQRATEATLAGGRAIALSRKRRRMTQASLAARVGISRARLAEIEVGRAAGAPLEVWFALGAALDRPFRAEYARDALAQPVDAGHLEMQELVLRLAARAGYVGRFELPTRPLDPARSIDVALVDRRRRRLLLVECWNSFGDLGAAARSSDRKRAEADGLATAIAADGPPFRTGLCWIVRDTAANRALVGRYEHIFAGRLPGSSAAWVAALTTAGEPPAESGFVWCDLRRGRLYARRAARQRAAALT